MIHYCVGDATSPVQRPVIIAHVVNNVGAWGRGFTGALSKWPAVENAYRKLTVHERQALGSVEFVQAETGIVVANMIAQDGIGTRQQRLSYEALRLCLLEVERFALARRWPVACPRIGCGLAGGNWLHVERMLEALAVAVHVYDLAARARP